MQYVIIIGCDNLEHSKLLAKPDGTTEVFAIKKDADILLELIHEAKGDDFARLVCV